MNEAQQTGRDLVRMVPYGRLASIMEHDARGWPERHCKDHDWPCPLIQGDGRRHLDIDNIDYD